MRTEQRWVSHIQGQVIHKFFSKRLAKDLLTLSKPIDIPNKIKSTFITGKVGNGKTVRAAFMMLQELYSLYLKGKDFNCCVIITVNELLNELKVSYNSKELNSTESIINKYSIIHMLVLDDFGIEKSTDWSLDLLYLIINRRYENMKLTIFTSNFSLKELAEKLGDDRIPSRIERMCVIEKKKMYEKEKSED